MIRPFVCYLLASAAVCTDHAFAQNQPSGLHSVSCLKLQPGKAVELREFLALDVSKVMQAGVDNGDFTSWYLLRSIYPAGVEAKCDYLSVITFSGMPLAPDSGELLRAALKRSGLTMTYEEYLARRSSLAALVTTELWRTVIRIATPEKGDYVYVNSMKVHNMNDWMDIENRIWKPLAEYWIKEGSMRSWMVNRPFLPSGSDLPYQAITLDVYPTWESAFKPRPASEIFRKIHPNKNMDATFESIMKSRDLARRELLRVEDKVIPSGSAAVVSQK